MTYGEVLQDLLDERGMKPAELARAVGVNRSTIGTILNGETQDPRLRMAKRIADALGVELSYFTDRMGI